MTSLLTFSLLYSVQQIESMLLCVCSVIADHKTCQNVVGTIQ